MEKQTDNPRSDSEETQAAEERDLAPDEQEPQAVEEQDSVSAEEETSADQESGQTPEAARMSDEQLRAILEALLLVSEKPLSLSRIQGVIDGISQKKVSELVARIQERLAESGFPYQIREIGGGYTLSTLPEYAPWVRKMYLPKAKASKLTQAALETLAVIAYKQPVTRGEIEAIRGVSVDSTLKTLLEKNLAEIAGYKDVVGKPATYGTTGEFLLNFGLRALSDLPSIEEIRRADADS
jgi:segregation and condensation protein B